MGRREAVWAHLGDLVKLAKELIEHNHQFLGGAVAGQACEAHDVSIEDAAGRAGQVWQVIRAKAWQASRTPIWDSIGASSHDGRLKLRDPMSMQEEANFPWPLRGPETPPGPLTGALTVSLALLLLCIQNLAFSTN